MNELNLSKTPLIVAELYKALADRSVWARCPLLDPGFGARCLARIGLCESVDNLSRDSVIRDIRESIMSLKASGSLFIFCLPARSILRNGVVPYAGEEPTKRLYQNPTIWPHSAGQVQILPQLAFNRKRGRVMIIRNYLSPKLLVRSLDLH